MKLNHEKVTQQAKMQHARNISVSKPEEENQFARPRRYDKVKNMYTEEVGYVNKAAVSHFVKSFALHKVFYVNLHSTIVCSNYCSGTQCLFTSNANGHESQSDIPLTELK
jgi:hypothetical protein